MKKVGQKGDRHEVVHPQYQTWGLSGKKEVGARFAAGDLEQVAAFVQSLELDLEGYKPAYANQIAYYQGGLQSGDAVLMRFEREDGKNTGLGGEHVSVIYDLQARQVLGLTRMQAQLDGSTFVDHQTALNNAIRFLKKFAPDLVPAAVEVPALNTLAPGDRMEFVPEVKLGEVQLNWIDDHAETIFADGKKREIHGMKIKLYLPKTELWAWVIVDKNGEVETFERNICWDFDKVQRKTQMWLHDAWLQAQNIRLTPVQFEMPKLKVLGV